jgi:hypothetical protein
VLLYANMPYADTVPAACDAGYHPNSNDADATINGNHYILQLEYSNADRGCVQSGL